MKPEQLTAVQEEVVDTLSDEQLEAECRARGIWFDESDCDECEDCPDCKCDDFEDDCKAIWQALYLGQQDRGIELAKALVQAVTGRYL